MGEKSCDEELTSAGVRQLSRLPPRGGSVAVVREEGGKRKEEESTGADDEKGRRNDGATAGKLYVDVCGKVVVVVVVMWV